MALADYRLCDVCEGKAFYDANLNYQRKDESEWAKHQTAFRFAGEPQYQDDALNNTYGLCLDYLGDWAVICDDCAKKFKTKIVPINE